jgi:geranylgeranyl reductase family protein
LNLEAGTLNLKTDVLVIGAGPAGSAAARVLAGGGLRVVLVDRRTFPRDKACGDALIPDALHALGELGVSDRVLARARRGRAVRVYAPNGQFLTIAGACACLPRVELDDLLRFAAVEAGAEFLAPLKALGPIEEHGIVRGARFEDVQSRRILDVRAGATILATGAAADVLDRFGMCQRTKPSATAARLYVQVDPATAAAHDCLAISYDAAICPGYGWIFPGPGHTFNVGIGYVYDGPAPAERNLRTLFRQFVAAFGPARELMRRALSTGPLQGAPLRTAMSGATTARPGLLVAGEAAGLTYSFTGEGIGKALQSGIYAAQAIQAAGGPGPRDLHTIGAQYAARLRTEFGDRFRAYERLQRFLARPWAVNLLIRRGNTGSYVRTELEALLNETGSAQGLVTVPGVVRALLS